jgi:hypothetical protein|tara:strand:+ start:421 stop:561 length:141 start_codon:yes stop_codon:yes gene_type:complete
MDVRTNYSHETKDSLILEYQYRVEALMSKIDFLEAQLEVVNNQLNK